MLAASWSSAKGHHGESNTTEMGDTWCRRVGLHHGIGTGTEAEFEFVEKIPSRYSVEN